MSLHEKIVLITGSSRGIGFSIAKELSEINGATVIVCSRNIQRALKASKKIKGKTFAAEVDVTNSSSIQELIKQITENYERIDILVNNAGYVFDKKIWYKNFHDISDNDLDQIIEVDLKGSVRLSRAVIPIMLKNNNSLIKRGKKRISKDKEMQRTKARTKEGGVIINISSTPAIAGHDQGSPYTIAKAANIALTKCIAREYGKDNIRAYSLALGNILTDATFDSMTNDDRVKAANEPAMKRWGKPHEVAKVVACIADDAFSFATGNTFVIDGGVLLL